MAIHPEVLWAQRSSESDETKNILYVTVNLPDIKPESLKYELTATAISFKAQAGTHEVKDYEFNLEFFAEVDPENSKSNLTSRAFTLVLRKKEKQADYWQRLTKEKIKTPYIKTDFSKWVDEDEQDGDAAAADDDMDMGGMGGMPGMGGMGGMPGMGGMGGMPGMGGMGGMPGMGGMGGMPGGMDFEQMMKSMGGAEAFGGAGGPSGSSDDVDEDGDDDDDGPPPLEEAEPKA
ncbi:co-chaperone p23 family protein [Phanerochaete sordida]|uniref:Co-chaperone p23 family protein n=1 Tax=Phanerochaete sordida TaxID=48140 RepID=A0A9P3LAT6_9APHY|nr:co-chaperone p23 family protein [Phanerochaete sordida]